MSKSNKLTTNPFERSQPVTREFFDIPLLGMVRANSPDSFNGDYNLDELVTNYQNTDQNSLTLEVLDNAMSRSGIIKGDYITVDLHLRPDNGDIVVVKLGEKFFIRRFFQENNRIRLETSDAYPSSLVIETDTPGFYILGKVLSLSRQF
jgi:SOS-response transcriptional repressor LexA